ncbi:CYTH domain-containing protein [Aureimonas jatrophae]|uniref:CYTH domain-containing protein n=1 Tax=Aureimonas jatrophae TaxID=1166073 RepID=A0A1H0D3A9_9HYPH|nr:CYTH domain-containing protein [Aureimonas jatrophae]MBB3951677.1 adenylate cyclase [Aureimonas jatrophae]SDN64371.1 CYTH domain-containing protein [Aureimonas jatrophae]
MGIEIERKFLVRDESWRSLADDGRAIRQFYIAMDKDVSVRLRVADGRQAWLTIKTGAGLSRGEYEYPVPVADAAGLEATRRGEVVAKRRFRVPHGELTVEIDVFEGALAPLVLAEIELPSEAHEIELPAFLDREVTGDGAYTNAALAAHGLPASFRG